MFPVVAVTSERTSAQVTQIWSLTGMDTAMTYEAILPCERLTAVRANESLLAVVKPRVDRQITGSLERLAARLALESSLLSMYPHVFLQTAWIRKFSVTNGTDEPNRRLAACR